MRYNTPKVADLNIKFGDFGFDRTHGDVFAVERKIARAILRVDVSPNNEIFLPCRPLEFNFDKRRVCAMLYEGRNF